MDSGAPGETLLPRWAACRCSATEHTISPNLACELMIDVIAWTPHSASGAARLRGIDQQIAARCDVREGGQKLKGTLFKLYRITHSSLQSFFRQQQGWTPHDQVRETWPVPASPNQATILAIN